MERLSELSCQLPTEILGLSMNECASIIDACIKHEPEVENGPLVFSLRNHNGLLITKDHSKAWQWILSSIDKQLNGTNEQQDKIKLKIREVKFNQGNQIAYF